MVLSAFGQRLVATIFSQLDQTKVVLELIDTLSSRGIAVLVISHNLTDVLNSADRIAVLYLGRMAAVEPVEDLNTASIVELMTTGRSDRTHPRASASQVQAGQHAGEAS